MRYTFTLTLLLALFYLPVRAQNRLQVLTFNAPPYSITSGEQPTGYATELIKEVLAQAGQTAPIEQFPLIRGLHKARTEKNVLIYPTAKRMFANENVHWIGKVASSHSYLFKHHSRQKIHLTSLADAKPYTIGVIRGSELSHALKQHNLHRIDEVTEGIQNVLKLEKNRIDLFACDELMLKHLIDRHNRTSPNKLDAGHFEKVLPLPALDNNFYLAMSQNSDPELVAAIKDSFKKVHQSGELIEVAHFWTNPHEQPMIDVYKAKLASLGYKWIDYTYEGGGGGNLASVLEAREQSNKLPHAIQEYAGPQIKAWARQGLLLSLDDIAEQQQWQRHLPQQVLNSITHNGSYYAAPANLQRVNWMWLNAKLFKQANIPLPRDWNELFQAAEKLRQLGVTPFELGGYSWQEGTLFELMVLGLGGKEFHHKVFIELDAEAFRSDAMARILKNIRRFMQYTDPNRAGRTWVQATHRIMQGEAAVYFMGDWVKKIFEHQGFPYGEEGYLCLGVPGTEQLFLSNVDTFTFPSSDSIQQASQKALAQTVMDVETQAGFNLHKGSIPARLDASTEAFDECSKISISLSRRVELIPSFNFLQIHPKTIQKPVVEAISRFINSSRTIASTQQELYDVVKQYQSSTP